MKKLLLHTCCGPCATPIIPNLNEKFEVAGFYYNPNIYPESEFVHRLDSAKKVTEFNGIKLIVPEPSPIISNLIGNLEKEGMDSRLRSLSLSDEFTSESNDGNDRAEGRNDSSYGSYSRFIGETKAKPERCILCYKQRLAKTAEYAKEHNFSFFSTTLLISPFQYHKELKKAGEEISRNYGVDFYYHDFRPLYRESREMAKELDLYLQKYCGCKFSRRQK